MHSTDDRTLAYFWPRIFRPATFWHPKPPQYFSDKVYFFGKNVAFSLTPLLPGKRKPL